MTVIRGLLLSTKVLLIVALVVGLASFVDPGSRLASIATGTFFLAILCALLAGIRKVSLTPAAEQD